MPVNKKMQIGLALLVWVYLANQVETGSSAPHVINVHVSVYIFVYECMNHSNSKIHPD